MNTDVTKYDVNCWVVYGAEHEGEMLWENTRYKYEEQETIGFESLSVRNGKHDSDQRLLMLAEVAEDHFQFNTWFCPMLNHFLEAEEENNPEYEKLEDGLDGSHSDLFYETGKVAYTRGLNEFLDEVQHQTFNLVYLLMKNHGANSRANVMDFVRARRGKRYVKLDKDGCCTGQITVFRRTVTDIEEEVQNAKWE